LVVEQGVRAIPLQSMVEMEVLEAAGDVLVQLHRKMVDLQLLDKEMLVAMLQT
jgi:hypothetical protein